jgi:hypothetical protein
MAKQYLDDSGNPITPQKQYLDDNGNPITESVSTSIGPARQPTAEDMQGRTWMNKAQDNGYLPQGPLGDFVKAIPEAAKNIIPSTGRLIGDVGKAVYHVFTPENNTIMGLGKLAAGTIEQMTAQVFPDIPDMYRGNFNAFVKSYADRYGGWDKFINEFSKNPAGIAADIATAAAGAGVVLKGISAGGKAAGLAELSKLAESTAKGLGTFSEISDPLANVSKAIKAGTSRLPSLRGRFQNPNLVEREAAQWAMANDIPIDAGAATGNPAVKGIQYLADRSISGSLISPAAKQRALDALKNKGGELAQDVNFNGPRQSAFSTPGQAFNPEQAGQSVISSLERKISGHKAAADTGYDAFRSIEVDPRNLRQVQVKAPDGSTVTAEIPLAVNMAPIKAKLQPIYDRMNLWMEPARRNASQGYQALKSILQGGDYMQASVAEDGLSGLKALAREGSGRNAGIAKFATRELQKEIDSVVSSAGSDAIEALKKGRIETLLEYKTDAVLKKLRVEPVQTFQQLIYSKDSGLGMLRKVAGMAPDTMKNVGRAYLEDLLSTATKEGGFGKTGTIATSWQKLGNETKKILFRDPALIKDLDNFFTTAKMMGENINPSGSGYVLSLSGQGAALFYSPLTQVPMQISAAALSKMLHSRSGVKLLTEGLQAPAANIGKSKYIFNKLAYLARGNQAAQTSPAQ